ncbi:MAG: 30S ribosome-binding factor RbfA [Anaerolineaceae bacterium]|jgi:ribosome-binding factor A
MPSKLRIARIADRIRNELSDMLIKELQDPRLSGVMVTDVAVDRELAFADIFVSAIEGQARAAEALEGLHSASGFIRRSLAKSLDLRTFPRIRFHWDSTPERADHIERLLASLHSQDNEQEQSSDENES